MPQESLHTETSPTDPPFRESPALAEAKRRIIEAKETAEDVTIETAAASETEPAKEVEAETMELSPEQREEMEILTRREILDMMSRGIGDEMIWKVARDAGEFEKFKGSSYYRSKEEGNDRWYTKSNTGNTSGHGYDEAKMLDKHIKRELGKYRELLEAFDSPEMVMQAIHQLENYEVNTTDSLDRSVGVSMKNLQQVAPYWEVAAMHENRNAGAIIENPPEETESITEKYQRENTEAGGEADAAAGERGEGAVPTPESGKADDQVTEGDWAQWVSAGVDQFLKPRRITEVFEEGGQRMVKFAGAETPISFDNVEKRVVPEEAEPETDTKDAARNIEVESETKSESKTHHEAPTPPPEHAREVSESDEERALELNLKPGDGVYWQTRLGERGGQMKVERLSRDEDGNILVSVEGENRRYPIEEIQPVESASPEAAAESESKKDRGIREDTPRYSSDEVYSNVTENAETPEQEALDKWYQNLGHKSDQLKGKMLKNFYGDLSHTFNYFNDKGTLARWTTKLSEHFRQKEEAAKAARRERAPVIEDGGKGAKAWEAIKDKFKGGGNALKAASLVMGNPRRWAILGGASLATGGETFKEIRFEEEHLLDQTRIEDIDKAHAEAKAVYDAAKRKAGGDKEVTKELVRQAYLESIPQSILTRLKEAGVVEGAGAEGNQINDVEKAHAEALAVQKKARELSDTEEISTEKLSEALAVLFEDPQPGQNLTFVGRFLQDRVKNFAQKANDEFSKIDRDESLNEEEKDAAKQKYLDRFGRSQTMQDIDRMLTETGKVDGFAATGLGSEKFGKAVVAGVMASTLYKIMESLPDIQAGAERYYDQAKDAVENSLSDTNLSKWWLRGVETKLEYQDWASSLFSDADAGTSVVGNDMFAPEDTPIDRVESIDNVDVSEEISADPRQIRMVGETGEVDRVDLPEKDWVEQGELERAPEVDTEGLPDSYKDVEDGIDAAYAKQVSESGQIQGTNLPETEIEDIDPGELERAPEVDAELPEDLPESVEEIEARAEEAAGDDQPDGVETRPYEQPEGEADSTAGEPTDTDGGEQPEGVTTREYQEPTAGSSTESFGKISDIPNGVTAEMVNEVPAERATNAVREMVVEITGGTAEGEDLPGSADIYWTRGLMDNLTRETPEDFATVVEKLRSTYSPEAITSLERSLAYIARDAGGASDALKAEYKVMLSFVREQVAGISAAEFNGEVPAFARASLEASK